MPGPATYFDPADLAALAERDARAADLIGRRATALGPAYRLFYREPVEFVSGRGAHLTDRDGHDWLDAYNNVPSVGHAHPRVADAIARQAATLNTHTRYLDEATITYAEQLLATFGDALGTAHVMFTCTGSEANDLALRIAKAATGGTGVLVTDNAYHGVTTEIAAISPSLGGPASLAPWVRVIPAPGTGVDFAAGVRAALASLAADGIRPAALIVDTVFASDGVHPEVTGFADAVAAVRAAGGIVIADEVQPGFGRLGGTDVAGRDTGLWGFARHGLEPDLVTLGKPMGNGYPIAAVVGRAELIAAFAATGRYFNTFGGTPVAIAAAQATLDVVNDEALPANARRVGGRIAAAVASMPGVVEVRAAGLFVGVELESTDVALEVVQRMRERRILIATADAQNRSLKIRPPLCFTDADADRLLDGLAASLGV